MTNHYSSPLCCWLVLVETLLTEAAVAANPTSVALCTDPALISPQFPQALHADGFGDVPHQHLRPLAGYVHRHEDALEILGSKDV